MALPLKDPLSRLFEPPACANDRAIVTLTIEALGPRWWIFHRSDGRSGGIFDDLSGALLQARIDARALPKAVIETIDADGSRQSAFYVRGELAGLPNSPLLTLVR